MASPNEILTPPLSGVAEIDAILGSYTNWEQATRSADRALQFSFTLTDEQRTLFSNVQPFSAGEQAAARLMLAEVSAATGIEFVEVADGQAAQLHFGNADLNNGFAGYYLPTTHMQTDSAGQVQSYDADGYVYLLNSYAAEGAVVPGSYGYQLLLHEIGHAAGLRHPHDGPMLLDPALDYNGNTVMTYENILVPRVAYQPYDLQALDWIYGGDGFGGVGARANGGIVRFDTDIGASISGGLGHDYLWSGFGDDTLIGRGGNDVLIGNGGRDVMRGGAGNDSYVVGSSDRDVIIETGGIDTVYTDGSWTLADGLENLRLINPRTSTTPAHAVGNDADNVISGNQGNNLIEGLGGNDTLYGLGANDTLLGGDGDDVLYPGLHTDSMEGGAGSDVFALMYMLYESRIADFTSGTDLISLDGDFKPELGEPGRFASDDGRFYSAPGASSGHDADDRVIYDPSAARLYFDPDGSGPRPSDFIANFQPGAAVVASDIAVRATRPNDLLLTGTAGDDVLAGGDGDDRLDGGLGADSMAGGLGDDVYFVDAGDTVSDAGGVDAIYLAAASWHLRGGFENLLVLPDNGAARAIGNGLGNHLTGNASANNFRGQNGADTLFGNSGNDVLTGGKGTDLLIGGTGRDSFIFGEHSAGNADRIVDFGNGADTIKLNDAGFVDIGALGRFAADDARFYAAPDASGGHDAEDRVVYDTSSGKLYYDADGDGAAGATLIATLDGAPLLVPRDFIVV